MKKNIIMTAIVAAASIAMAQELSQPQDISAADAERANADLKVSVKAARDTLKAAFAEFAKEAGVSYGVATGDGRFYSKGQAYVNADYSSPQFIKSRSLAYERAYLDAISRFMIDFYGYETTQKLSSLYEDRSEGAEEAPAPTAKSIGEKVAMLTDAQLNSALAAAGVPPDKYSAASIVERRKLFQSTLANETMNKALHASSGCIPVKTFEAVGDDGRYAIGVIVRYDRTSKELAKCFKLKVRPAIFKSEGLSVEEALPPEEEMTSNFGVRLYFDETGTPSLLSFGQWGCSYTGKSAARAEREEDHAINQARLLADSSLTTFINSFADVAETGNVSESIYEGVNFTDDNNVVPEEFSRVVDVYRKSISVKGSDTMKGRSTVYDSILEHPNGQKVAVVVRRWSFGMVDAVDALDKPLSPDKPESKGSGAKKEGGVLRKGRTYDF